MLVLNITNASKVVAVKTNRFFEALTPDRLDQKLVEEQVMKGLIEQLRAEGIEAEVALVDGLEFGSKGVLVTERLRTKHRERI